MSVLQSTENMVRIYCRGFVKIVNFVEKFVNLL